MKEEFPSFNQVQKSVVARTVIKEATTNDNVDSILDEVFTTVSKFERRQSSRVKENRLRDELKRDKIGFSGYPIVFYMCSRHSNCAVDHTDYEGKLYYDRFWRMKYKDQPEWIVDRIQKFIDKYDLLALQYIIKGPVWLTTRPYCKHFFTSVDTIKALTMRLEPVVTHGKRLKRGQSKNDIKKRLGIS